MNQNMSGEPTNYIKLQCPDCGARIDLIPAQRANCPACGRKFLIDEAGGLVVNVNVDYGDARKNKTAFTLTLIILGYILGFALTVLLIIFGFNSDAIHSRMSASDYEWFNPKSKVSHKFCEDIFGKDYKEISKKEFASVRYIKYDNERLSGTNEFLHIIEYSFTDYRDCENEDAFMKTVKKWTFQESSGDEAMDFSMFTGLTRVTVGGYSHNIGKNSFAKSADIRYVTTYSENAGFQYIQEILNPVTIEVLECKVWNHLEGLESFPNLKSLNINIWYGSDFDFSRIEHCKNLETLVIKNISTNFLGLSKIGTLTNLKSLSLENQYLHESRFIGNLTNLEELTIQIDDENPGTETLKNLKNLNSLHLLGLGHVPTNDIASFDGVEELKLSVNTQEAVNELANLKNLKVLDVRMEISSDNATPWDRKSILDVSCLAELPAVEYLYLQPEPDWIGEDLYVYGLEPILNHPKLKGVYINEQVRPYPYLIDAEVTLCIDKNLLKTNNVLKQLQFVGCTFEDVETQSTLSPNFIKKYINLEYLVADSCGIEKITFVKSLPNLKYCSFAQNEIEDFTPLKECKFLEVAGLYNNPNTTPGLSKEVVLLTNEPDGVNLTEYLLGIERTVGYVIKQETDEDE